MDARADMLRHRVALYRRYLAEGVSAELAIVYLREIAEAEAELAGMGGQGDRGNSPASDCGMLAGMDDRRVRLHWECREAETLLRQGVDELGFALWLLRRIALDQAELVELDRAAAALAAELDAADRQQPQPQRARRPWLSAAFPDARETPAHRMAWRRWLPIGGLADVIRAGGNGGSDREWAGGRPQFMWGRAS